MSKNQPAVSRPLIVLIATLLVALVLAPGDARAQSTNSAGVPDTLSAPSFVPDQLIVKYHPGFGSRGLHVTASGITLITLKEIPLLSAELIAVPTGAMAKVQADLAIDPAVAYVEPNYLLRADVVPDDSLFSRLWGLHNQGQTGGYPDADIDAVEAWELNTGSDIVIGVIDTGVDSAHSDLRDNIWINVAEIPGNGVDDDQNGFVDDVYGWDFYNNDNDPFDDHSHGTHVAGTIAATGNNTVGIAGVCWSARIMPLKFLGAAGFGTTAAAVLALQYAIDMGAALTCNSWGGGAYSQALVDAIDSAAARGMLFVAAAGNSGANIDVVPHYPAAYDRDNIISVAATDHFDRLANEARWGSNWGALHVDLGAPGVQVYSTIPEEGYDYKSGTSMATPHVAGAVALLWSEYPDLSYSLLKERLLTTVDLQSDLAGKCVSGGRLNLYAALADPDTVAPAAIFDLAVTEVGASRVTLGWTAPGDDGDSGAAATYDIRYAAFPIDSANFDSAPSADGEPVPGQAGTAESFTVTGLDHSTTYFFAIRAIDDWFNVAPVVGSVTAATLGPPIAVATPDSLVMALQVGESATAAVSLRNSGVGELLFDVQVTYPHTRTSGDTTTALTFAGGQANAASLASPIELAAVERSVEQRTDASALQIKDVLLVYADVGAQGLQSILESYPDIGRVDTWAARNLDGFIPTLSDLVGYDVVVAWNNRVWADVWQIGEVLAAFIDQGGAVVSAVDCWGSGQWVSHGRYFDEPGYSPFRSLDEALFVVRTLGWYDRAHPIMAGVNSLAIGSYYNDVELSEGARAVARWDDGTPLVAINPHTVGINIWPGDGYHWLGDFPTLIHNAIRYAAGEAFWLAAAPGSGEILASGDTTLTVTFNAEEIYGGNYDASVEIYTNDPDDPLIVLPIHLQVTGTPRLVIDTDLIDFADVFLGYPQTVQLTVASAGTDSLHLENVTVDHPAFQVDVSALALGPDRDTVIEITCSPAVAGPLVAQLTLESDDPDRGTVAIALTAIASDPPVSALSPDTLTQALFTGGRATRTFTLRNAGEADLEFAVTTTGPGPILISTRVDEGDDGATFATDLTADHAAVVAASDLTPLTVAGSEPVRVLAFTRYADVSPGGEVESTREIITELLDSVTVTATDDPDPERLRERLREHQVFFIPEQENALPDLISIGASWAPVLADFVVTGGIVIFCQEWGGSAGFISSTGLLAVDGIDRGSYITLTKEEPLHPLLEGVSDTLLGTNLTAWYDISTADAVTVVSDSASGAAVVAVRDMGAGAVVLLGFDYYSSNHEMDQILANAVGLCQDKFTWLTVDPAAGVIPRDGEQQIQVTFDAAARGGGDYPANVIVASNDPVRPRLAVVTSLHVTDAPHIAFAVDTVEFDTVFLSESTSDTLLVTNEGTLPLIVQSVGATDAQFVPDTAGFTLAPDEQRALAVTFTPVRAGLTIADLRFLSNDSDSAEAFVRLVGHALVPPDIAIAPDSLSVALSTGQTVTRTITVENRGANELVFNLATGISTSESAVADLIRARHLLNLVTPLTTESARQKAAKAKAEVISARLPGIDAVDTAPDTAHFETGWETHAPLAEPRSQLGLVAHPNGRIYAFGGIQSRLGMLQSLEIYDPGADSWSLGSPVPVEDRGMATAVGSDGRIYFFNANLEVFESARTWKYDPATDSWEAITSGPPIRGLWEAGAARGADGRIYVIGGEGDGPNEALDLMQIYEPMSDSWTLGAPMPTPRYQLGVVSGPGGFIYAMGGRANFPDPPLAVVEVYDPVTDSWSRGSPMPTPRNQFAITMGADGRIYTLGGKTSYIRDWPPFYDVVEIYDPLTDTWSIGPPLPTARGEAEAVLHGDRIYVIGGSDSTSLATTQSLKTPRWLSAEPSAGVLAQGEAQDIAVTFDARALADGTRAGELQFWSNDPDDRVVSMPVALQITGAPHIAVFADTLTFDTTFVGSASTLRLPFTNTGQAPLQVFEITADGAAFSSYPGSLTVLPGQDTALQITFTPEAEGIHSAHLVIRSDALNHDSVRVGLFGVAVLPPQISIAPASFAFDLLGGERTEDTLTIENNGSGPLTWSIPNISEAPSALFHLPAREVVAATAPSGLPDSPMPTAAVELADQSTAIMAPLEAELQKLDAVRVGIAEPSSGWYENIGLDLAARGATVVEINRFFYASVLDSIDVLLMDGIFALRASDLAAIRAWLETGKGLLLQGPLNSRTIDRTPEFNTLVAGSGIVQYPTTTSDTIHTQIGPHAVTIGVDSVSADDYRAFSLLDAPAFGAVMDEHDRASLALSRVGAGRVAVSGTRLCRDDELPRGDTRLLANRTVDWLSHGTFLQVSPAAGVLAPGSMQDVVLDVDATDLMGGEYHPLLTIESNDPLHDSIEVPVRLDVTGVPRVRLDLDTLDLGVSFIAYGTTELLRVRNGGSDVLTVSGMDFDRAEFSAVPTSFTVPVFGEQYVAVSMVPLDTSFVATTLTIESDDPDAPTTLIVTGSGLVPPEIVVPADSLRFALFAGETLEHQRTIANLGGSELLYEIEVSAAEPPESAQSAVAQSGYSKRPPASPLWDVGSLETATSATPLAGIPSAASAEKGSNSTDGVALTGTYVGEHLQVDISQAGEVYMYYPHDLLQTYSSGYMVAYIHGSDDYWIPVSYGGGPITSTSYVERVNDSLRVIAEFRAVSIDGLMEICRTFTFDRSEKNVRIENRLINRTGDFLEDVVFKSFIDWDLDGDYLNDDWDYNRERNMVYGYDEHYAAVASRREPDFMDIEGRDDWAWRTTTIDFPTGPVVNYDGAPVLHFELGDLLPFDSVEVMTTFAIGDSLVDLENEVMLGLRRLRWLTASPEKDQLPADSTRDLTFTFDARELLGGEYYAAIDILSNDPATPTVSVPVHLTVTGAASVTVDRDTLDFGTVYVGYPVVRTVKIANVGTDDLVISAILAGVDGVSADATSLSLPPGADTMLAVTFAPLDSGAVADQLVIVSNDPNDPWRRVWLHGVAALPAAVSVQPDSIDIVMPRGDSVTTLIRIANDGEGDLHWFAPFLQDSAAAETVSLGAIVSLLPSAGTVPPGAAQDATLVVRSAPLTEGDYRIDLALDHNDPARPAIVLPLTLQVYEVQLGDVNADRTVNAADIVYLAYNVWWLGPDPFGQSGDLDCNGAVGPQDVVALVNYVFRSSPPPVCE